MELDSFDSRDVKNDKSGAFDEEDGVQGIEGMDESGSGPLSVKSFFASASEFVITFLGMGFLMFQGAIGMMQIQFVDQGKWMSRRQFVELYALSQPLPGTVYSRMVMGIAMHRYGSNLLIALLSNLLFVGPGFIMMLILGMVFRSQVFTAEQMPLWLKYCLKGLVCSGIAFAMYSCYRLVSLLRSKFEHFVAVCVTVVGILYRSVWIFPCLILVGSISTWVYLEVHDLIEDRMKKYSIRERVKNHNTFRWYDTLKLPLLTVIYLLQSLIDPPPSQIERSVKRSLLVNENDDDDDDNDDDDRYDNVIIKRRDTKVISADDDNDDNENEHDTIKKRSTPPASIKAVLFGLFILFLFITMWLGLSVSALFVPKDNSTLPLHISEFFYRMGALIFGGLRAGIPMLQYELVTVNNWMTDEQFMTGYALGNAIPGSFSNVACFYGVITASTAFGAEWYHWSPILYGILAGIAFQLPGILTFLSIYPLWHYIKSWKFIKRIVRGVQAVCIGYILSNVIILWIKNVGTNVPLSCVIVLCLWFIVSLNLWSPIVVFLGTVISIVLGMSFPSMF